MILSFHHNEFHSIETLVSLKKQKNLSISVVIPALNESKTIGHIVSVLRKQLVDQVSLIDELVVIDGNSSDDTSRIAKDAGAVVYSINEAGPDVPSKGKGTSLWKSQFVTTGDIVAFIDSDIMDFDTRFAYKLLGPLLNFDNLQFVKAYYRRSLLLNGNFYENYGGRVTEILVRPLLSSLVPDLAKIYQPLAGECAIRRSVMEAMPFPSGYGVEIGLLFDLFVNCGSHNIAQVDMETRCHRNRSVYELGKTSFAVMQTLLNRLEHLGYISFENPPGSTMISQNGNGWYTFTIKETELPPKNSIDL